MWHSLYAVFLSAILWISFRNLDFLLSYNLQCYYGGLLYVNATGAYLSKMARQVCIQNPITCYNKSISLIWLETDFLVCRSKSRSTKSLTNVEFKTYYVNCKDKQRNVNNFLENEKDWIRLVENHQCHDMNRYAKKINI